jgi:hypothetical protein
MAKVVKVKATRRNGKVVKAHTRTVKGGGASKTGAGKELAKKAKQDYSDDAIKKHVASMILKDRLGNGRHNPTIKEHPDYIKGAKAEKHLQAAGFLDNEGSIKTSAKKKFPKAHAHYMKHADY